MVTIVYYDDEYCCGLIKAALTNNDRNGRTIRKNKGGTKQ